MLNSVNYAQIISEVHGMCERLSVPQTVTVGIMTVYYANFVKYINNNLIAQQVQYLQHINISNVCNKLRLHGKDKLLYDNNK